MTMNPTPDKKLDVIGVGSWTNFDHLFVVDRLPMPGDTVQILGPIDTVEQTFFGGCAPNNVAAAARLGARTGLVGVVGRDFIERGYQRYFLELGVDLDGVTVVADDYCGHSFLYSDRDGQSICLSHLGVASRQDEFEPNHTVLTSARVAVINYRFDHYTLKAASVVKHAGGLVILSGAVMTAPSHARSFTEVTDILVCTEHELQQLLEHLELTERTDLFKRGLQALIVTRGKRGSQIVLPDRMIDVPICKADKVVDTTGAGDSFVGGFAFGLASGYEIEDCARLGAVVASFVVEAVGCQTNLPTFAQAAERFAENFQQELPSGVVR